MPRITRSPDIDARRIGRNLRLCREAIGYTQTEVSRQLGWTTDHKLSYIENGHRLPTLHVLVNLCYLYGRVPLDDIVFGDGSILRVLHQAKDRRRDAQEPQRVR